MDDPYRCRGTNSRYATRCKRIARPGFLCCGLHASQEEFEVRMKQIDDERALEEAQKGSAG